MHPNLNDTPPNANSAKSPGNPDPADKENKEQMMQYITTAIIEKCPYGDHALIEQSVHQTYDDLLDQATVTQHIGVLTEGIVLRKIRHQAPTLK